MLDEELTLNEALELAKKYGVPEAAARACYAKSRRELEYLACLLEHRGRAVKRRPLQQPPAPSSPQQSVLPQPPPQSGGERGRRERKEEEGERAQIRLTYLPWQVLALAASAVFIAIHPLAAVLGIVATYLFSQWFRSAVYFKAEPGHVEVEGLRLRLLKLVRVGVDYKSMMDEDLVSQIVQFADSVNGVARVGGALYALVPADADVEEVRANLLKMEVFAEETSDVLEFPEDLGMRRLVRHLTYYGTAVIMLVGAVIALSGNPLTAAAAVANAVAYYYLSQRELKMKFFAAVAKNPAIKQNFEIRSFVNTVKTEKDRLPKDFLIVYKRDDEFETRIEKAAKWSLFWGRFFESPVRLMESYRYVAALNRFASEGIKERGMVGFVFTSPDAKREFWFFKLGRLPARGLVMKSADVAPFTPYVLVPYAPSYGFGVAQLEGGTPVYFDPVEITTRGHSPHVIIFGITGAGKTSLMRIYAYGIKALYSSYIVALDLQGNLLPGVREVNLAKCRMDFTIEQRDIDILYGAARLAYGGQVALTVKTALVYTLRELGRPARLSEVLSRLAEAYPYAYAVLEPLLWGDTQCDLSPGDMMITARGVSSMESYKMKAAFALLWLIHRVIPQTRVPPGQLAVSPDYDRLVREVPAAKTAGMTVEEVVARGASAPPLYVVLIDEAHMFLHDEELWQNLWVTVRKWGIVFIAASQHPDHFAPSVISNTSTLVFLQMGREPRGLTYIADIIGISRRQIHDEMFSLRRLIGAEEKRPMLMVTGTDNKVAVRAWVPKAWIENPQSVPLRLKKGRRYYLAPWVATRLQEAQKKRS